MPSRIASLFAALKLSPGVLPRHGRMMVVVVALVLLAAATTVYIRTTWTAELTNDVIAFTALFVVTALTLIGFARSKNDRDG